MADNLDMLIARPPAMQDFVMNGLAGLADPFIEARRNQTVANALLPQGGQAPDYAAAARALIRSGQMEQGLGALKMGQTQQAGSDFARGLSGIFGGQPAGTPPQAPQGAPRPAAQGAGGAAGAIASIESGGRYDALGPVTRTGDRAYGKYQVMGANIPVWTQEVLGRQMTPQEFIASPEAQDAVFQAKFGQYTSKYGPEGAAKAWFAGERGMNNPNARDQLGTTVADYARKFVAAGGAAAGPPPQAQPAPAATPTPAPAQGSMLAGTPLARAIPTLLSAAANPNLPQPSRDLAKELLKSALDEAKLPNEVKEYVYARAMGEKDDYTTWLRKNKASGATIITNDMKGESEYAKATGKHFAELNKTMIEGAASARNKIATLERMNQLLQNPAVYTGKGGEVVNEIKRAAQAIGVNVEGVPQAEVARALANQFALELRNPAGGAGMPGAMSDKDREFLVASVPGLTQSKEGNALLVDYMKRVNQRAIDVERLRQKYVRDNKRLDEGFYKVLSDFSDANPLFPEAAQAPAPGTAPAAPAQAAPTQQPAAGGGWQTIAPGVRIRERQ